MMLLKLAAIATKSKKSTLTFTHRHLCKVKTFPNSFKKHHSKITILREINNHLKQRKEKITKNGANMVSGRMANSRMVTEEIIQILEAIKKIMAINKNH